MRIPRADRRVAFLVGTGLILAGCGSSDGELSSPAQLEALTEERKRLQHAFDSTKSQQARTERQLQQTGARLEGCERKAQALTHDLLSERERLAAARLNLGAVEQMARAHDEGHATSTLQNAQLAQVNSQLAALLGETNQRLLALRAELESHRGEPRAPDRQADDTEPLRQRIAELERQLGAMAGGKEVVGMGENEAFEQAKQRAVTLNKTYRSLLKKQPKLGWQDQVGQAAIDATRNAFEEAQREIANLRDARGIYTVQPGDTLFSIAAFFYQDGDRWVDIFKANNFLIRKPNLIYTGMVLVIPR
jgi:predicted  nucleic acid-binding Zn-ribbon protein